MRHNLDLIPLYIYISTWPLIYSLIEISSISLFFDNEYFILDFRLFFYSVFLLIILKRMISGISKKDIIFLCLIILMLCGFVVSFIFNMNSESLDFKPFFVGVLPFTIILVYVWLFRYDINFSTLTKCFALALIFISVFGFYSFSRFLENGFTISLLSGGLSEQLWRFAGGKTQYIPAVLFLSLLSSLNFREKLDPIVFIALIFGLVSILLSSQRAALIVIPFVLYSLFVMIPKSKVKYLLFIIIPIIVFFIFRSFDVLGLIDGTFVRKIQAASENEQGRITIWISTISILTSSILDILFGVGFGSLSIYNYDFWPIDISDPHNVILYFWSFGGLISLSILMFFLFVLSYNSIKSGSGSIILYSGLFVGYWTFAGFYFYVDSNKSDLNLLIVCLLFTYISMMKERRYA